MVPPTLPTATTSAPGAPGPRPAGRHGHRAAWVLVGTLLLALALVGCFGKDEPSPHVRFEQARDAFIEELGPGGRVVALDGSLMPGQGGTEGTVRIEYGSGGVTALHADAGAFFSTAVYCQDGDGVQKIGEDVYASRHQPGLCDQMAQTVPGESPNGSSVRSIDEHEDGMTAVVEQEVPGESEKTTETWYLDRDDEVTRIDVEADGVAFTFDVLYGERVPVPVPEPNDRLPLQVQSSVQEQDTTWTWNAVEVDHPAPLGEFTAHLVAVDREGNGSVAAAFPLDGGEQTEAGHRFGFMDQDGDGLLSAGDRFSITANGSAPEAGRFEVQVFDEWADRTLDDNPVPLPWLAPLAGLALVALWRRRR